MRRLLGILLMAATVALTLLLSAFHGFVGWHKAFSPYEELARHSAWTVHLPMWAGRAVGWTELAATAALLAALLKPALARVGVWACAIFIAMECVATAVHYFTRDGGSLLQNGVSISLTVALAWLHARRASVRAATT